MAQVGDDVTGRISAREAPIAASDRAASRVWLRRWAALIIVLVASISFPIAAVSSHTEQLSPVDEWVYLDYLQKVPTQGIVRQGEVINPEALDSMACVGVLYYGAQGPPCAEDYASLTQFPMQGKTSADAYTPVYFYPTWLATVAIQAVSQQSFLESARYTGALWLAATSALLFLLLREFGVGKPMRVVFCLLLIASPFSWWTFTYVSTDAPSVALGCALLYLAVRFLRGAVHWRWLLAVSVIAVLFKVTNILAVGLAAVLLLTFVLLRRWRGSTLVEPLTAPRSLVVTLVAVGISLASVIAEVGWLLVRALIAVGPPPYTEILAPPSINVEYLLFQLTYFLPNTIVSNVAIVGMDEAAYRIPTYVVLPLSWICIVGVLGFLAMRTDSALVKASGIAIAIAGTFFGPILVVAMSYLGGVAFEVPARYGAPLLGGFLLGAAILAENRVSRVALGVYSVLLYLFVMVTVPALG